MSVPDVICLVVALGALGAFGAFLVAWGRAMLPAAQAWQVLAKVHESQDERVHTALARLTSPAASPQAAAQVAEMERRARAQGFTTEPAAQKPREPVRDTPIPPMPVPASAVNLSEFVE